MLRSVAVVQISAQSALPTELQVTKEHARIFAHVWNQFFRPAEEPFPHPLHPEKPAICVKKKKNALGLYRGERGDAFV